MIGRRPVAAFGNSTGDRQMLEYTKAGGGARLAMLVLHDDAVREYAYGPAQSLPDSKVGTFTQALYDEAIKRLDGDQHEERLETCFRLRGVGIARVAISARRTLDGCPRAALGECGGVTIWSVRAAVNPIPSGVTQVRGKAAHVALSN